MRRNLLRSLAVALIAGGMTLIAAPKDAEAVSLNLINNWRMGNLGTLGNQNGTGSMGAGAVVANGIATSTNVVPDIGVNMHFGIGVGKGDQVVPFIGLNVDRVQLLDDVLIDTGDNTDNESSDLQMLVFGLEVGGKFFFIERAKGKAPPFLYISFFKYFANLDAFNTDGGRFSDYSDVYGAGSDQGDDDREAWRQYDNARHSPLGFNLAFGAEYYFNDNFALGGTFLGLRFSYARATALVLDSDLDILTQTSEFNLYTGLTLTYRFSFSVRASVQFESDYDYED